MLYVLDDLIAKGGIHRQYCPEALGQPGLSDINENSTLLVDYALSTDFVVVGAFFFTTKRCISTHGRHQIAQLGIRWILV